MTRSVFISEAVCEGCGDCSVQSTCVSLTPVETDLGTKRKIDQSSCNKDYSCLNGFCPSFITVRDANPRKPEGARLEPDVFDRLPAPLTAKLGPDGFNMMVTGIGGTGVITVAAIIGMAAHLEGRATSLFDMTGLAQKNGAVFSHVRINSVPSKIHSQRIGRGETDLLLAFDLVGALAEEAASTLREGRTRALVNSDVTATVALQFNRDASIDTSLLFARLARAMGASAVDTVAATQLASTLLGDSIGANLFLVGVAVQRGLLPVGLDAIERAVALNGTAVAFNLTAFRLGRLFASDPEQVFGLLPAPAAPLDQALDALVGRRERRLTAYQNAKYAARYRALVDRVRSAEQSVLPGSDALALVVARNYAKLLAYKDEYEVARLLSDPALHQEIERNFADGAKLSFNLAPPGLHGKLVNGRPRKREFDARWMRPALRLLSRCNWLRGTAFDPFGRTSERRVERALISEYEALVEHVLAGLTPAKHRMAVDLLGLVDAVRGYGPVKAQAVETYAAALPTAVKAFDENLDETRARRWA